MRRSLATGSRARASHASRARAGRSRQCQSKWAGSTRRCTRTALVTAPFLFACAYRKSSPSILVVPSTEDRTAQNGSRCLWRHVISARLCSAISECACHYSSPCRTAAHGAGGVRRTPRYDRGIPCGSNRSTALRMRFTMVNAETSGGLECRSIERGG
jgi:hypothetical protein